MSDQPRRWNAPSRLANDPGVGALLEESNLGYRAGLNESAAFRRLSERMTRQKRPDRSWHGLGFGAVGLAAAIAAVWGSGLSSPAARLAFGPDVIAPSSVARDPEVHPPANAPSEQVPDGRATSGGATSLDALGDTARTVTSPTARDLRGELTELGPSPRLGSSPERVDDERTGPAPEPPDAQKPAIDCLGLARQGKSTDAQRCFEESAAGSGLSAEVALYEVARLRRDVLRDPDDALAALSEYRQRFPRGHLRTEVDIFRVEILVALGRSREALNESEQLLATRAGKERASELYMLRGNVYRQSLAQPALAAAEYAAAEGLGGSLGAEATQLRGSCLEALGDVQGALDAYRSYLATPGQARSADVSRRVEELTARLPRKVGSP